MTVILEWSFGVVGRTPHGLRVIDDGRVEFFGDVEAVISEGRIQRRDVPLQWRHQWTYTGEQLAALRAEIVAADEPPLAGQYGADSTGSHPQRHVWRFDTGEQQKVVTVDGWPHTRVAALDRLQRRIFELHPAPAQSSVWRIWTGAEVVERQATADPSSIPVLAALAAALFVPAASAPVGGRGQPPPEATPLVSVTFSSAGEPVDQLQVSWSGRWSLTGRDGQSSVELPAPRLAAIEAAIAAVDWPATPPVLGPRPTSGHG